MENASASKNQTVNSYLWDQDQTLQTNTSKFLKRVKVWDGNSQKLLSDFNIILSDIYVVCQHLLQLWDEFYSTKANLFMMTSVKTTKYLYPNFIISQNDCVSFLIARKHQAVPYSQFCAVDLTSDKSSCAQQTKWTLILRR